MPQENQNICQLPFWGTAAMIFLALAASSLFVVIFITLQHSNRATIAIERIADMMARGGPQAVQPSEPPPIKN